MTAPLQLTREHLLSVLNAASSQHDTAGRQEAEFELRDWKAVPGFHSLLQEIYLDSSVPLAVRWLSIIVLKNNTNTYWRKSAEGCIPDEEKEVLRSRVFNGLNEPNRPLLAQNSAVVAAIARYDFPQRWADLFDRLNDAIQSSAQSGNLISLFNSLHMLNQIVKKISQMKAGRAKPSMLAHTPKLLTTVSLIYTSLVEEWTRSFDLGKMEVGYLALKVAGRLLYDGLQHANREAIARDFFSTLQVHFNSFLTAYASHPEELLAKHIKLMGKIFVRLLEAQTAGFVLMPSAFSVVESYLSFVQSNAEDLYKVQLDDIDDEVQVRQTVVSQGFEILLALVLSTTTERFSRFSRRTDADREETQAATNLLQTQLFTEPILVQLLRLLLQWYLRTTPSELESWQTDPEAYFVEDIESAGSSSLSVTSKRLYEVMMSAFKDDLVPTVLEFMQGAIGQNGNGFDDIIVRDAAFMAFGTAAPVLKDYCSFDEIMKSVLVPQVQISQPPEIRIIRRRLCLVLADWACYITDEATMKDAYRILLTCLDETDPVNDLTVQLHSLCALRYCVESFEIDSSCFRPFADPAFRSLFKLMGKTQTIEAKSSLLNSLSAIVEAIGVSVSAYSVQILEMVPLLWDSEPENLQIDGVILQTLASLISALGNESTSSYHMVLPVLQSILPPSAPMHTYLFEDALPTWQALVENAPVSTDELLALAPAMIELFSVAGDSFAAELTILKSYIRLDPARVLTLEFQYEFYSLISDRLLGLQDNDLYAVCEVLRLIALVLDSSEYFNPLLDSGLLHELIGNLADIQRRVMTSCRVLLEFLSLLAISQPNLLLQVNSLGGSTDSLLGIWLETFERIGSPAERKLYGLAFAQLATTGNPVVMARLEQFVDVWCQVLDEVSEAAGDSGVYYDKQAESPEDLSPDETRQKQLTQTRDPVHTVDFRSAVRSTVERISALPEDQKQAFTRLDPEIVKVLLAS